MKKLIYLIAIFIVTLASCTDPFAKNSTYVIDTSVLPAASYMNQTDSLNVSLWVQLLKYTDLYNTLNLADDYTCFVPNDAAMKAYLASKGVSTVNELNLEDAKILVKYHTIQGALYSAVSFDEGLIPDTTATGDYLSSSFDANGGEVIINSQATIIKTVKTSNGYIHILNATLTPITQTIWDKLQSNQYSIFRQALQATGYDSLLSVASNVANNILYKYHYTLFAVPDSVFQASGISSFNILVDSLGAGSDFTSSSNGLKLYIGYHLLNQQISYASLSAFSQNDTKRSKNYNTMASNQLLNVSDVNKTLYINYNTTQGTGVGFIAVNQNCKNGVMHVVNNIMTVKIPNPTTIQWELTDYSVLASFLPKYRTSGLTSTYTYQLTPDMATCYNWLSIPDSKPGLFYVIANKNDAVSYKAVNYDYLRLNLGTYGWVEMTSPTIVAGTYKVTIGHYNPLQPSTIGPVGKIWFIIDGNYMGVQVATQGASTKSNQYLNTTIGTITFKSSTTHKLRILAADNYTSDLDCLTFTPQ